MSQQEPPDDVEQLQEIEPRGEHRESESGFIFYSTTNPRLRPRVSAWRGDGTTLTDIAPPPRGINDDYREYYLEFPFVQAALTIFNENVIEPGWQIEAIGPDGEVDEDMTEALELWGKNCAIHAGEPGHDISNIIGICPALRRTKPAVFIEKVGTNEEPDSIAALQLLDPATMSIRLRRNQNIVVQPDDPVHVEHPRTENGDAAAYVQYDTEADIYNAAENAEIAFTMDDILKLTYDPPEGSPWGRTIWPAIAEYIDGFKRKVRDRGAAIELAGHPHRIYSSDTWSLEQAKEFAEKHETGETSAWDDNDRRGYGGRVDYVPHKVNIQVEEGHVADIKDAIMDDIEAIFSMLPVSKFKIAYEEGINQFVVEPQQEKDDMWVDKERRYLKSKFEPLFREKADELAGGDGYAGDVSFTIHQPPSDNPLDRSDFDPDAFKTFVEAFTTWASSNASSEFAPDFIYEVAGMDPEDFTADPASIPDMDESDDAVQEAADALGFGNGGSGGDDAEMDDE